DPEREAEEVQLEPFLDGDEYAEDAGRAELIARAARARCEKVPAQIILADRRRREIGLDLGDVAQHERDERVRVRTGPDAIAVGVRVTLHRLLDLRDRASCGVSANLRNERGGIAEPARIRRPIADADRRAGAPQAPAV